MVKYYYHPSVSSFPKSPAGINQKGQNLHISKKDLKKAMLQLSYNFRGNDLKDALAYYKTCLKVAIDKNNKIKPFYSNNETSIKSGISFILGTVYTVLIAEKKYSQILYHLNEPWVKITYKKSGMHPDFIGMDTPSPNSPAQLVPSTLFEAKGGGWLEPKRVAKAEEQLGNVDISINQTSYSNQNLNKYIVFAHAEKELNLHIIDPDEHYKRDEIIIFDQFEIIFQKYYSIINLLSISDKLYTDGHFIYSKEFGDYYGIKIDTIDKLHITLLQTPNRKEPNYRIQDICSPDDLDKNIIVKNQIYPSQEYNLNDSLPTKLEEIKNNLEELHDKDAFSRKFKEAINLLISVNQYNTVSFTNFQIIKQEKSPNHYSIYYRGAKVGIFTYAPTKRYFLFKLGVYGYSDQREGFLDEIYKDETILDNWEINDNKREFLHRKLSADTIEKLSVDSIEILNNFSAQFQKISEITFRHKN